MVLRKGVSGAAGEMARGAALVAACCAAAALALALVSRGASRRPAALALEQEGWQTEPGLYDFGDGNVGMGPVYYGDTRLYGAVKGREGQEQPWPKYDQYRESDVVAAKAHISKEWTKGYVKDFQSYFPASMRNSDLEIPDPVNAGYWPFLTQDGVLAQGDPVTSPLPCKNHSQN